MLSRFHRRTIALRQADQNLNLNRDEMRKLDLEAMDFDELWLLHEQLTQILSEKISAEKLELENRLAQLNRGEARVPPPKTRPTGLHDADIQKFCRNTVTRRLRRKPGPVAGNNRAGSSRRSNPGAGLRSSGYPIPISHPGMRQTTANPETRRSKWALDQSQWRLAGALEILGKATANT